ncbi:hypothetical protein HZP25_15610 [Elizabethkingia anophelis]|nr:hypothetical protein [Elizabethkingia anophelis]
MKNNFIRPPLLVILLLLLFYACRSEDHYLQENTKDDMRFATFVPKDGKPINYVNGFEYLIKKYDTIHKTNKSGINNRPPIGNLSASIKNYAQAYQSVGNYVEFRVRSQVIKGDEGQIIMLFPRVENNTVKGLVMTFLVENGTKLGYVDLDEKLDIYKDNISEFKAGYMRLQKRLAEVKFNPTASVNKSNLNLLAVDYRNPDGRCDPSKGNPDLDDIQYCKIKEIAEVIMTKYNFVPFTYTPTIRDNLGPYEREQFELYMKLTGQCRDFIDCLGGGGGPAPAKPVDTTTICGKIRVTLDNPKFKEKFEKLTKNEIFDLDHEMGSFERYPPKANKDIKPAFADVENYINTTNMELPDDKNGIIGLIHSHNNKDKEGNEPVKAPSPTDVRTFINIFMTQAKNYTGSYQNAYSVITTSTGNYMLRYSKETWPTPEDGGKYDQDRLEKWDKWYRSQYEQLLNDGPVNNVQAKSFFTQFLKEAVKIDGLEFYEIDRDLSGVTKLEYNPVNSPNTTRCR